MISPSNDTNMILFGAGSSVPFGIPGMSGFTKQFLASYESSSGSGITEFLNAIQGAIGLSEQMVGISFSFDLESLLSVLNDLSEAMSEKPISIPTASLLLKEKLNIKAARDKYRGQASIVLDSLRNFVFQKCMEPIKRGKQKGNFKFLNRFYGPLMTVLNSTDIANIESPVRKIYSTNWDLCFKTWADYINTPVNDGTDIDQQSLPVFNVTKFDRTSSGFNYTPLHGSLDLVKTSRPKGAGSYEDILKISDPVRYFEDKPANIKDVFMIYPLEAIGYEESVKSPYLDMLNNFRTALRLESTVFIIGYSLRDPTIGSIFEEVIAERIRKGDLNPLSKKLNSRIEEVGNSQPRLKIIVLSPNPDRLAENLRKQGHTNLLQTFVPIKIEFPKITDEEFDEKFTGMLFQLIVDLRQIGHINVNQAGEIVRVLKRKYKIPISEQDFQWKKEK